MLSLLSAVLLVTLTLAPAGPEPRGRVRRAERIDAMLTDPARRVRALDPTLAASSPMACDNPTRSRGFSRRSKRWT